jgi:hypothetical protein
MRFQSRSLWTAKDSESPKYYEDAFCLDAEQGVAAIADGVSAGIFSGQWARILTQTTVAEPPNLEDITGFQAWLARQRAAWAAPIDVSRLAWHQRPKMIDGAMSTLLWLILSPNDGQSNAPPDSYRLESFAIGDCCLFHIRQGQWLRSFPLQTAAEFNLTPGMIGSIDQKRDHLLEFHAITDLCLPGDLLVLCTDALAQWALGQCGAGSPVNWELYWEMPFEAWQEEIAALRRDNQIRYDDTTLLLLRVVDENAAAPELCSEVGVAIAGEEFVTPTGGAQAPADEPAATIEEATPNGTTPPPAEETQSINAGNSNSAAVPM